ncbi:type I-E CRISPR-associated protein Cse1/CasA [Bifidobacterium favimelis]|uniref:Type I-E CRISPR-associated protein Cse1/CasA n=1 Tax=Bifidobacterium favimelis TaxID=3122979 RepID=A0ABU8ZM56_9BIFI
MINTGGEATKEDDYNLLDRPWVNVTYTDGHVCEVSLKTLLLDAHLIREISGDMPQQTLPILRTALAVLYRAYGKDHHGLAEKGDNSVLMSYWKFIWDSGRFDQGILKEYLDEFHDRFYLFDSENPFYQTPGLEYYAGKGEYEGIGELIADVPKPEKFLFSMRAKNELDSVSSAEAARWLLFFQAYDIAGNKPAVVGETHSHKNKVAAPHSRVGTGWLGALGGIYLEGPSLFHTLMLNWALVNPQAKEESDRWFGNSKDLAPWERKAPGPDMNLDYRPTGVVDMLTLQSRRVRLIPDRSKTRVVGIIKCYGDCITAENMDGMEPMTAWRKGSRRRATPPYLPATFTSGRAIWRQLQSIISTGDDNDVDDLRPGVIKWVEKLQKADQLSGSQIGDMLQVARIHVQGMTYGKMNGCYEDAIDDSIDANLQLLHHDASAVVAVVKVVKGTEKAVGSLADFAKKVEECSGMSSKKGKANTISNRTKEEAYSVLDDFFRQKIADITSDTPVEEYREDWILAIFSILWNLARGIVEQSNAPSFVVKRQGTKQPQLLLNDLHSDLKTDLKL